MKKILMLMLFAISTASAIDNKMYIDAQEMDQTENVFRLHIGHNQWIETNTVHRDASGLYTFENSIMRS